MILCVWGITARLNSPTFSSWSIALPTRRLVADARRSAMQLRSMLGEPPGQHRVPRPRAAALPATAVSVALSVTAMLRGDDRLPATMGSEIPRLPSAQSTPRFEDRALEFQWALGTATNGAWARLAALHDGLAARVAPDPSTSPAIVWAFRPVG